MTEQISPEVERVALSALMRVASSHSGRMDDTVRAILSAALPHLRAQIETEILHGYDQLRDSLMPYRDSYDEGRLDGMEMAARIARGEDR